MSAAPEAGAESGQDLLKKSRLLVFDFDGTLVDSVPIKFQAFDRCFEKFPAQREKIRAFCRGNNHTPRWEKFKTVYEEILHLPYTREIEQELHRRFERETTEQIARAPEIPGASEFLSRVHTTHRTALLSSTPHEILLEILEKRGWSGLFQSVQGAPVNKGEWLKHLTSQGFTKTEVLFFGDTPEDASAAREAGCGFIYVPDLPDFRGLMGGTW